MIKLQTLQISLQRRKTDWSNRSLNVYNNHEGFLVETKVTKRENKYTTV